ncbi:MAG: isoprenylcysteine carboxylmethyltransferase family protein [Planctomycetota bacterium]|nr:isoprenylcysteine carboxylmethyltransferase family protein [Planctomycetota bacterium]
MPGRKSERKQNKILPPTWLVASILIMLALHFLLPLRKVIPSPYRYLGILPMIIGILLNVWSDQLFKKNKTTVKPFEQSSRLITQGPYRFSRHPMYLGMVLILAGLAVLLGTASPTLVVPVFFSGKQEVHRS